MLIVEIKKYDPETGMKVIHYLELESENDDDPVQDYVVRHVSTVGENRTRPSATVVQKHRAQDGELRLLKRALTELQAQPVAREVALV